MTGRTPVAFDLYKADGTFEGTYTTGSDGTVAVNDLPAGEHYWIEIRPAEGYMLDTSKHEFTVSHDYGRKENGYEYWTVLKEVRDWSELER